MMRQITDQLYIGDISDARERDLSQYGITAVVTVCQDEVSDNISVPYYWFNMSDGPADTYGGDHSYSLFVEAVDTVRGLLSAGETVLVHCHAGISRSVTVSTAALAVENDMYFDEAYQQCKLLTQHSDQSMKRKAQRYIRNFYTSAYLRLV